MSDKDYNYIWNKGLKAYRAGDFSEINMEPIDTLIKARGFLHLNSVHTNDWNAFNKYIDDRERDAKSKQIEEAEVSIKHIPKKQKRNLWKKIRRFGLIIGIIAAIVAILTYFGIKPRHSVDKQIAQISFERSHPFVNRSTLGNDLIRKYWPAYFFQIRIFNKSYNSNIRIKYLKLSDLRKSDGAVFKPWENAIPIILAWPPGISEEIAPREYVFVPFARIFPVEIQKLQDTLLSGNIEIPQLRFIVARWDRQMTSHVPPGTHRFKLTVFFENEPPAEAEFELEWSGEQRENLDVMAKDIKIKQIN